MGNSLIQTFINPIKAQTVLRNGRVTTEAFDKRGPAGRPGAGGITQAAADARYIRQAAINAANGVAGLDSGAKVPGDNLADPPINLSILFENALV